ncbi:MAG: DNA-formamidopyrimidine glycosylase [Cyanobacteria bacterium P01_F01_bin.42]
MPELPEVETVRRGLNSVTCDRTIERVEVLYPRSIGSPGLDDFTTGLKGCAIVNWSRRGKYLLAALKTPQSATGHLGVHLRMSGQLLWVSPKDPLQKHTRVRLLTAGDMELRFVDQRTFGQMWWVPPNHPPDSVITGLQKLGPEPFSDEFSTAYLYKVLRHRKRPIKNALLDQSIIAGIGNIYADEALFLSGIRPTVLCAELTQPKIKKLHQAIQEVLKSSITLGGTSFSSFMGVTGVNGNYGPEAWVYGRKAQPCRTCSDEITQIKLAGRSAHYCPSCQK